jgi:hypothetical protein
MRIARNHSGLGAFLFKFHLLRLRRLSSHPFHARRLIDLDFTIATRWSVFPRCTFRKEMVIYPHRSMSLSACWNSFIIDLFNTETRYDTPTRKSSFSWDGDANTWGVARAILSSSFIVPEVKPSYHGQIFCSLQVEYMKRFEAGKVQPVFFLPKNTMSALSISLWGAVSRLEVN